MPLQDIENYWVRQLCTDLIKITDGYGISREEKIVALKSTIKLLGETRKKREVLQEPCE